MKTFKEYIKEMFAERASDSSSNVFDLIAYDILNDETFPDQETDGLMVRSYIRSRQIVCRDDYGRIDNSGNDDMIAAFEALWTMYKAALSAA